MIATVAILSVLASMALPYAKMTIIRNHEIELQRSLREIRTAIDAFHKDWEEGKHNKLKSTASSDGYPLTLDILVNGVQLSGKISAQRKYLRRIPPDPFADQAQPTYNQWQIIGYRDDPDTSQWNGEDVYDVRSRSRKQALNKSYYRDW